MKTWAWNVVGTGYEFGHNDDYQRTTHYVKDGTLIYDDVTGYEFEQFVEKVQPDLVGSGIKEKYVFQKMGVPFRQMHSWDYSGPTTATTASPSLRATWTWPSTARSGADPGALEEGRLNHMIDPAPHGPHGPEPRSFKNAYFS
jgi:hypothetical protein